MALARIAARRINNYDDSTESTPEAIQCRLHFEQMRDALQRAHYWNFNAARVTLSQDTSSPPFEWDYQFLLPSDFIRLRSVYDNNDLVKQLSYYSYAIEGKLLLTNSTAIYLRYSKRVTDPAQWDPLFTDVLVLALADRFISPLAGGDPDLKKSISDEFIILMRQVKALDRNEGNTLRRQDMALWNDARYHCSGLTEPKVASS